MLLSDAPPKVSALEPECNRRVHWSSRVGVTSNDTSIKNIPQECQRLLPAQSSRHPKVHSPTLGVTFSRMTRAEAQSLLAKALAQPHRSRTTFRVRLRQRYLLYACPGLILRLRQSILRSALRWPVLQRHLGSIRKLAAWGALRDRARLLSGEALSTSERDLLVRQLEAYRDEMARLVTPNGAHRCGGAAFGAASSSALARADQTSPTSESALEQQNKTSFGSAASRRMSS